MIQKIKKKKKINEYFELFDLIQIIHTSLIVYIYIYYMMIHTDTVK